MNKPIKVAVIGTGKLGIRHCQVYSGMPGIELVGVCDVIEARAKEAAQTCKTKPYFDYHDLLKSVDAVSVVVPSVLHHKISKDFLENHVHVLIEKPMTATLAEADELLQIAKAQNRIIQVGHIERFNSAIRAIKSVIKTPKFIECHRLGPYDPRVTDVGVTLDLMIHDLDIILDLVKSPIKKVDAVGASVLSKTEDIANARILFENNCVCDLTASRVTPDVMRKIRIFQDNASITLDYVTQEAFISTNEKSGVHQKKIDITKGDSLKEELKDFIECVRHNKKPLVSGEEGRRALELALQISKQIHDGKKRSH